jgi:hypothetical protein
MKLQRCALMCALLCGVGVQVAAGAAGAAGADGWKEPGETEVRIERVEPEETEVRVELIEPEAAERARAEAEALSPRAVPTPLKRMAGDAVFREAYADVYRILSAENACSRFYGGPARAAMVFNQLAERLRPARLPHARTGSRMSGGEISVTHAPTGQTFRLFEQALINSEGAFYRRQVSSASNPIPNVGRFGPATREARALILLHELGHLLRGPDGAWVLKDDGRDEAESVRNTERVEDKCGAQIRALAAGGDAPRAAGTDAAARAADAARPSPDEF